MTQITTVMEKLSDCNLHKGEDLKARCAALEQMRCDWYNEMTGNLRYVDCDVCRNKGYIAFVNTEGFEARKECECMKKRRSYQRLRESGLEALAKRYTFKNYRTNEGWQEHVKNTALKYLSEIKSGKKNWFYCSGQQGSGKTHICIAAATNLIASGYDVCYKIWQRLFQELNSSIYDNERYSRLMEEVSNCEILYIDDFLKVKDSKLLDRNYDIAFEIINNRYNSRKITIISSEKMLGDVERNDIALAGRIAEMTGLEYNMQIGYDPGRNIRKRAFDAV